MTLALHGSSYESAEPDQLLEIAISAALIRTQLDRPLCTDERDHLTAELEQVEMIRHVLEQQVTAQEHPRRRWWQRLLQV
jgi:hypothetical protein